MKRNNSDKLSKIDRTLVARYVDGEMAGDERSQFERRLGDRSGRSGDAALRSGDAALRAAEALARGQSQLVRGAFCQPGEVASAPAGFAASVIDSVRRMPSRAELIQQLADEDSVVEVVGFARRLTVAAAVVFAVALLFGLKVLVETDTDYIQASDQELRELDQRVKAMKMEDLRLQQGR